MNTDQRRYFLFGIIISIVFVLFSLFTFLFSDLLLEYSGITTFYSLLAIFLIFAITEHLKKVEKSKEDEDFLRTIFRVSKQIEKDLNYYTESLGNGLIPPTTMGSFVIEGTPLEIKSKSTKKLDELIIFSNSKIETINEWKEGYLDVLLDPDPKWREKALKRFNEVWSNNANQAIMELRKSLEEIRSELSKWIKVEY